LKFYSLKTEVEKGFLTTAFDQELIDPKSEINLLKLKLIDVKKKINK